MTSVTERSLEEETTLRGPPTYQIYRGDHLQEGAVGYRICTEDPPTPDDFRSYVMLKQKFKPQHFFKATGVSLWTEHAEAVRMARSGPFGSYVATLDICRPDIFVAWPASKNSNVTVWGSPRVLAACVQESE